MNNRKLALCIVIALFLTACSMRRQAVLLPLEKLRQDYGIPVAAAIVVRADSTEDVFRYSAPRDIRYGLASGTKVLTAMAILRLAETGELNLDTPAREILREFPRASFPSSPPTVRHLLTHTSGLMDDPGGGAHRAFPPGLAREYSNTGYGMLASVVEEVSGKTYEVYLAEKILPAIGIQSATIGDPGYVPLGAAGVELSLEDAEALLRHLISGGFDSSGIARIEDFQANAVRSLDPPVPVCFNRVGNWLIQEGSAAHVGLSLIIIEEPRTGVLLLTNTQFIPHYHERALRVLLDNAGVPAGNLRRVPPSAPLEEANGLIFVRPGSESAIEIAVNQDGAYLVEGSRRYHLSEVGPDRFLAHDPEKPRGLGKAEALWRGDELRFLAPRGTPVGVLWHGEYYEADPFDSGGGATRQLEEVLQHANTHPLALLGMKLCREEVSFPQ